MVFRSTSTWAVVLGRRHEFVVQFPGSSGSHSRRNELWSLVNASGLLCQILYLVLELYSLSLCCCQRHCLASLPALRVQSCFL